jgi:hypothetical protein
MTFIKPVRQELPASTHTGVGVVLTESEARQFYNDLLEGRGEWMKFFEGDCLGAKSADSLRAKGIQYVHCSAMKPYRSQIEVKSRKVDNKMLVFARVKV